MQIGMIGLGRMGAGMARRIMQAGCDCVVYDSAPDAVAALVSEGARAAASIEQLVAQLRTPRAIWLMLPAATVEIVLAALQPLLARDDIIIDGGNSDHRQTIRRARELQQTGIQLVDVGVSGGVWGLQDGYCLMIGGAPAAVGRLEPVFTALAQSAATDGSGGWLHCGPAGAGHFVKMIHNGVEYALMAAYAEGLNVLARAGAGKQDRPADAETAPLADPDAYRYNFDIPAIAELWRRGSVVRSWLLDLTARALHDDPQLARYAGRVADSGEGRWALKTAVDLSAPAPLLAAALFGRFSSRGEDDYANRLLSAMREQFGGHAENGR